MKSRAHIHILALLAAVAAVSSPLAAQRGPTDVAALRSSLEAKFDILPLRDGVALRPREAYDDIKSIEVTSGPIAIDGQPVTGAELRKRLGADADTIIEISYLSDDDRRALTTGSRSDDPRTIARERARESSRRVSERVVRRMRDRNSNDRVRIGGSQTIREGEVVNGDVVSVLGSVTIDGEVHGDAVAIGGRLTLGPHAHVMQDAVVVGGGLTRDPAAVVDGDVSEVGLGGWNFGDRNWPANPMSMWMGSMMGSMFDLVTTLTRLSILCLLAALVILLGRGYVERTGDRVEREPLKAGAVGLLAQVLFIPVLVITIVVLVMTIVGIPLLLLLPFVILGLMIVGLLGFTSVTYRVGRHIAARFRLAVDNPYLLTMLGIVVVMSPLLLARLIGLGGGILFPMTASLALVGWLVEYLAWTIGFGAVALARFNRSSTMATANG